MNSCVTSIIFKDFIYIYMMAISQFSFNRFGLKDKLCKHDSGDKYNVRRHS